MKMYCKIKRPDNSIIQIEKGEKIVIQEKLDGSNTAIYKHNEKLFIFSRTQKLEGNNGLNGFVKYIKQKEKEIFNILPNGYVIFGEWLNQGKISYNSLAKQGKIEPYYVFDIAEKIEQKTTEEGEDFKRTFVSMDKMKELANKIGFKTVPELDIIEFNNYDELKEKYVDNQKSALEGTDCIREGIVIKTLDGSKRLKIVADKFQEVKKVKNIKNNTTKSPYDFIDKYITPMRIDKFLTKIEIENPKPEDFANIFKKLDIIADDIVEEEKEELLKDLSRIIRKQAVLNIKDYILGDN